MAARRGLIIGAGGVARLAHFPAYSVDPNVAARLEIVGVVDPRTPPPELGTLPTYPSLRDAAAAAEFDFVDICTPTATHQPLVLEALASGLHVFCEKPVAINRADAIELSDAARRRGRVLYPCHQYRENPAWRALRWHLDDGAIGRWHLAEFYVSRAEADRGAIAGGVPWRGQRASSLGGVLLDHGTHLLYLMLDVAGMPGAVLAHLSRLGHATYDVEDTAHVVLDYGDRLATITLTWAGRQRENRIRFVGDRGTIEWTGGLLRWMREDGTVETTDYSAQLEKREYAGWMSRILAGFADAMDRGECDASLREVTDVATLLGAAYQSSDEGRRVTIA